jgi:hypothetical protein
MSDKQPTWIEQHCARLVPIEWETLEKLGEQKGGFFIFAANDWLAINSAVLTAYPGEQSRNLVMLTFWGLFKEVCWLHFLFVAANYPMLLARLRFVWESAFRAYFAEHYPMGPCQDWAVPSPRLDDRLAWLDEHGKDLRWDTCIEPVLRAVFPLADREQQVRDHYNEMFKHLHRYAHPSAYLTGRMLGDSALQVRDGFDLDLALEVVGIGAEMFDLIWMAVFAHHPDAFERVEPLSGKYPVMSAVFESRSTG